MYKIPAGAVVRQRDLWNDPEHFNFEANFLKVNDDGTLQVVNSERLIPFGVGKRQCPGEVLARQVT